MIKPQGNLWLDAFLMEYPMPRILLHHILPFLSGFFVGVLAFYLVMPAEMPAVEDNVSWTGSGSGSTHCHRRRQQRSEIPPSAAAESPAVSSPTTILSTPRATYTDAARENGTEGTVLLKVTLLASGEVGDVRVIRGLPDGLTEQAVKAARKIEFEPKVVDGQPVSVTQTFEYTFDSY